MLHCLNPQSGEKLYVETGYVSFVHSDALKLIVGIGTNNQKIIIDYSNGIDLEKNRDELIKLVNKYEDRSRTITTGFSR